MSVKGAPGQNCSRCPRVFQMPHAHQLHGVAGGGVRTPLSCHALSGHLHARGHGDQTGTHRTTNSSKYRPVLCVKMFHVCIIHHYKVQPRDPPLPITWRTINMLKEPLNWFKKFFWTFSFCKFVLFEWRALTEAPWLTWISLNPSMDR